MNRILGKYYKWFYLLKFSFTSTKTGLSGFLVSQFSDVIQALAIVYIWIVNDASKDIIIYLIIGRIFKALSDCFVSEVISPEISNGKISNYLLYPSSFIGFNFVREVGRRVVFNFGRAFSLLVPVLVFLPYINLNLINSSRFWLMVPLLIISFVTSFYIEFIVGFGACFFKDQRNYN
jgi:ABC-type uncharacterized transport system permease subunit